MKLFVRIGTEKEMSYIAIMEGLYMSTLIEEGHKMCEKLIRGFFGGGIWDFEVELNL